MLVLIRMCARLLQPQAEIVRSPVCWPRGTQWHLRVLEGLVRVHAVTVSHLASERLCLCTRAAVRKSSGIKPTSPLKQPNRVYYNAPHNLFCSFQVIQGSFSLFLQPGTARAHPSIRLSRCYGKTISVMISVKIKLVTSFTCWRGGMVV